MKLDQILHSATRMKKVVETQLLVLPVQPVRGEDARLDIIQMRYQQSHCFAGNLSFINTFTVFAVIGIWNVNTLCM